MHWHTCKSLLNTLGRAVEQLAVCIAKQAVEAKVQQSCKAGAKRNEYLIRWCQSPSYDIMTDANQALTQP